MKEDGKNILVTNPLDGCVLPGITRDSIIQLVKETPEFKDIEIQERNFSIDEFLKKFDNN